MNSCPKCGGTNGYFDKNIVKFQQFFSFDGVPLDASEMQHVKGGQQKFCADCFKRINIETEQKGRTNQ